MATVRDSNSLPKIDESIDTLGEGRVSSTLGVSSEYEQIEIDENNRSKNAAHDLARTVTVCANVTWPEEHTDHVLVSDRRDIF